MATEASNRIKYRIANGDIAFDSDTFKCALMAAGFVFNKDSHHGYADISASELATAYGYTAGGATLAGVAVTEDDTNDRTAITWTNPSWTASGGNIVTAGAIIYDDTASDDPIVGYIDFVTSQTTLDGGVFTISGVKVYIT